MPVKCHVAAFHLDDSGDQRRAIQVGAPVLELDFGWFRGQDLDPFPHRHPIFQVLPLDIFKPRRDKRFLPNIMGFFQGFFVGSRLVINLIRHRKPYRLGLGKRILNNRDHLILGHRLLQFRAEEIGRLYRFLSISAISQKDLCISHLYRDKDNERWVRLISLRANLLPKWS